MPNRELRVKVRAVVEADGDTFHAYAPDLKGCHACGETAEKAMDALHEGVALYLSSLSKHSEPLPEGVVAMNERAHGLESKSLCPRQKERLGHSMPASYLEEVTLDAEQFEESVTV